MQGDRGVRYLDLPGLSPSSTPEQALIYASALGLVWDSTDIPPILNLGDKVLTGPWGSPKWTWLPKHIPVEIVPDGGKITRTDPLSFELKKRGLDKKRPVLPTLPRPNKKTPREQQIATYEARLAKYEAYQAAISEAEAKPTSIQMGDGPLPYELITDPVRAEETINSFHGRLFAYDYETTSRRAEEAKILGVALSNESENFYIAQEGLRALPALASLLTDPTCQPIAHGSKYEYKVSKANMGLEPIDMIPAYDTQVLHWLAYNSYDNGLKEVTRRLLDRDVLEFDDIVTNGATMESLHNDPEGIHLVARYAAAGDSRNTYDLYPLLRSKLEARNAFHIYTEHEMLLTPVLAEMELAGMYLDRNRLREMLVEYSLQMTSLEANLRYLGFRGNLGSDEDLARWFYDELGFTKLKVTKSGRGKMDKATLSMLNLQEPHPEITIYLAWSVAEKLVNTFLLPRYESGLDWFTFSIQQTSTMTGRLSSSNPNIQNWPSKVRDIIVPPPGHPDWKIGARDYNQIEPRIGAVASGDPRMLEAYAVGGDPYIELGRDMGFDEQKLITKEKATRTIVKAAFLGVIMYGGGSSKLQEIAARDGVVLTLAHAREIQARAQSQRPEFMAWRQERIEYTRTTGEAPDLWGRYRLIPAIWSKDPEIRSEAERQTVNMVPQGTSAGIIKPAMPKVHRLLKQNGFWLFNQVHDEVVYPITEQAENDLGPELDRLMTENPLLPLKVEPAIGSTWLEAKPQ